MFLISRQVREGAAFDLLFDPVRDTLVTSARTKVLGHLLVPVVVFRAVKPFRDPAPLGQRQLLNRSLDFLDGAHALTITAMGLVFKHSMSANHPRSKRVALETSGVFCFVGRLGWLFHELSSAQISFTLHRFAASLSGESFDASGICWRTASSRYEAS